MITTHSNNCLDLNILRALLNKTASDLIKALSDAADASFYNDATEEEREELLAACEKLQRAVSTSMQSTWRTVMTVSPAWDELSFSSQCRTDFW